MKAIKILSQVCLALGLIGLFAYLFSLFLMEKPIDWNAIRKLEPNHYAEAIHGTWRNTLTRQGNELQALPNNGQGAVVSCSANIWKILPNGPGEPTLENSIALDSSSTPVKVELVSLITQEHFVGIVEINKSRSHLRFLLRHKTAGLPLPSGFDDPPFPVDIYQEFVRVAPAKR